VAKPHLAASDDCMGGGRSAQTPEGQRPMLIIFGGLPGVGKTTVARELARQIGALHLRIDSMEQAIGHPGWLASSSMMLGTASPTPSPRITSELGER
jgi:DNA polymerase III delta prime subunit